MSEHNAEYFRQRGCAAVDSACGPFSTPKFPPQAVEPHGLEELLWPRNLFGDLASIDDLMVETGELFDRCRCRREHKQTLRDLLPISSEERKATSTHAEKEVKP
jgi:hypothetical protein